MAQLAFANLPGEVEISDWEIQRARKSPTAKTYTYDTLLELKGHYGELAMVIGTDQLEQLHRWYRFPELMTLCHWIVLTRKGHSQAQAVLSQWEGSGLLQPTGPASGKRLILCPTDARELSSTQIRESFAKSGHPPEKSLMPTVEGYLMQRGIYGTGQPSHRK